MITWAALHSLSKESYTFTSHLEQHFQSVFPYSRQNHLFWLTSQHLVNSLHFVVILLKNIRIYLLSSDILLELKMRISRSLGIGVLEFFFHWPALLNHLFPARLTFPGNCSRRGLEPWVLPNQLKSSSALSGCRTCCPSTTSSIQDPKLQSCGARCCSSGHFLGNSASSGSAAITASFSFCKLRRGEVEIRTAQLWAGSVEGNKAHGFQWIFVAAKISGATPLAHTEC